MNWSSSSPYYVVSVTIQTVYKIVITYSLVIMSSPTSDRSRTSIDRDGQENITLLWMYMEF